MTTSAPTTNKALLEYVESCTRLCKPDRVHWCDGSQAEYDRLMQEMCGTGLMSALDQGKWPGCYFHRSDSGDVARVEHLTFICSRQKDDAGPNNNWKDPVQAKSELKGWFDGCMKGRTMYVIPYCMGPVKSPYSKVGIEITDSPYVTVNMKIMTRMGKQALEKLGDSTDFVRGLHSTGELSPDKR